MSVSYSVRQRVNWSSGGIAGDHPEVVAALLDRGDVDLQVLAGAVGDDGVAGLVHGDRVPLALDVLDVLGRAELLELLGLDHVLPGDDLAAVADRVDQRLVDQVLDRGAGGVRRDRGQLVDLLVGELVRRPWRGSPRRCGSGRPCDG